MALQTKAIKQKMKSVGSIKKITKTMEMISISKMKKAVQKARASKDYAFSVFSLISHMAKNREIKQGSYLFSERNDGNNLVIVIASNKGLCGSYNINTFKKLSSFVGEFGKNTDCITVGKYAEKSAIKLGLKIIYSFINMSEKSAEDDARLVSREVFNNFKEGKYRNTYILYTEFQSSSKFSAQIKKILPLEEKIIENILFEGSDQKEDEKDREKTLALSVFEPSMEYMLEFAVPKLINSMIYQIFLESLASEHSSRMLAMKKASDNASEIFKELNLAYNHARQDGITQELSEIVRGAGALEIA